MPTNNLPDWVQWIEIVYSAVATLAILTGGFWTWKIYHQKRQKFPRAELDHQIFHYNLDGGQKLLRVHTVVKNIGDILIKPEKGLVQIRQVMPLPNDLDVDSVERVDDGELEWPVIAEHSHTFPQDEFEIEPQEQDEIHDDFILDTPLHTVMVYSHLSNIVKGKKLGWSCTTMHNLK